MNKSNVLETISQSANKAVFGIKKHSPEILIVAGITGVITSAVLACKATTKISDVLEPAKDKIDICKSFEIGAIVDGVEVTEEMAEQYTENDRNKEIASIYLKTGFELTKLYAPSIVLGVFSIAAIISSHNILQGRNVALASAYVALDSGFKEYRNRVKEKYGEQAEKDIRYGIEREEIEEVIVDEKGKEKTVKTTVEKISGNSVYSKFFDEYNANWDKNADYNLMFVRAQQEYANQRLRAVGHLFLNEVYDMLGIPRTKAGQVVGWVYDPDSKSHGDNYVSFGIYDGSSDVKRLFVNGDERSILLDFNVDGPIMNTSGIEE